MDTIRFLEALKIGITGYLFLIGILLAFYGLTTLFVKLLIRSDKGGSSKEG